MEKRVFIAFALSSLIMIGWFILFAPPKQPVKTDIKSEPTENQRKISGATTSQPSAVVAPGLAQPVPAVTSAPLMQAREITVETPLYKAVLSNAGPTIRSFQLKKYRSTLDSESPLVELVDLKAEQGLPFEMAFLANTGPKTPTVVYELDTQEKVIKLDPGASPRALAFKTLQPDGLAVEQVFTFYSDKYPVDLKVQVINNGSAPLSGAWEMALTNQTPTETKSYSPFIGQALFTNNKVQEIDYKKLAKAEQSFSGKIGWLAYENGHFLNTIIIPEEQGDGRFLGKQVAGGVIRASYTSPQVSIAGNAAVGRHVTLYFGPKDLQVLKTLGSKLEKAISFGWFDFIAKPCLYFLRFLYKYIPNYGVAIIILTILIKILFWPLTFKSYQSMKEMQKLQPHMARIREQFKNNREQMNKEMMSLYRTYKINPLGGCLPMVIQIPVFIGLYNLLRDAIELRHAPFLLWVNDLSAPERLFHFSFSIPFMYPPYGIPVMTLLMGASMFIQQKMTPTPGDPMQAKMMLFLPIIFTVFFINIPSGLVLYWLINNIISIGQQYQIMKKAA